LHLNINDASAGLKPGEMQVETPEWMKKRPEYRREID
jgi:hypothetical protein